MESEFPTDLIVDHLQWATRDRVAAVQVAVVESTPLEDSDGDLHPKLVLQPIAVTSSGHMSPWTLKERGEPLS